MGVKFEVNKLVIHRATGCKLWMLREGREQILCRTEDLREIWFYPDELVAQETKVNEERLFG